MSPYYMWYSTNYIYFAFTLSFQFLFQFCIPALIMVKCNVSLYQQLRNVQKSNKLTASTNESIRKSVFRAKFTLSITAIFIIGSMITWLPSLPNDLIHWKPEQFQELESETSIFVVIGVLVYVINCSGNYFVYKYLKWKETKVKKPKSQFHVDLTQSTNQSNLSSAVWIILPPFFWQFSKTLKLRKKNNKHLYTKHWLTQIDSFHSKLTFACFTNQKRITSIQQGRRREKSFNGKAWLISYSDSHCVFCAMSKMMIIYVSVAARSQDRFVADW